VGVSPSSPSLPETFPANTGVPGQPVDINGDGIPDLLTGPVVPYTAGQGLNTAAIADFNRDGAPDLLFTNISAGSGNFSSNTFTVLTNIPRPVVGRSIAVQPEPSSIGQVFTLAATLTPPQGSTEQQFSGPITFFIDRV